MRTHFTITIEPGSTPDTLGRRWYEIEWELESPLTCVFRGEAVVSTRQGGFARGWIPGAVKELERRGHTVSVIGDPSWKGDKPTKGQG